LHVIAFLIIGGHIPLVR